MDATMNIFVVIRMASTSVAARMVPSCASHLCVETETVMRKWIRVFSISAAMALGSAMPLNAGSSFDISPSAVYDLSPSYLLAVGVSVTPVGITNAVLVSTNNSGDGGASIQLGGIGLISDSQLAGIQWSVTGSGVLAFDWKVSSELGYDWLRFYTVGSAVTNQISGTTGGWSRGFVTVTGATSDIHTFRWEYSKDPSDYVGQDCGWIDAICWAPFYTLTVTNGSGSGSYTNGSVVLLAAATPPTYFTFDRWTGDTNCIANVTASNTTLTMPATGIEVTATYKAILYSLSVANGSGAGAYTNGTVVAITAGAPPTYFTFDHWSGYTNGILDVLAPSTTITILGTNTTVSATYRPILYPITVTNGTGSGTYTNGSSVAITANTPPVNQKFDRWVGNTNSVANIYAASTILLMPATTVTVSATYVSMLHTLTVINGSGGGTQLEGSTVNVSAAADPLYQEFTGWTGDGAGYLANASARSTSLTMPTRSATLTATYRDSIARAAGCYGRTFTNSGTTGGVTVDATAGSPSGTPAVKLGGTGIVPDNGFAAFETVVYGSGSVTFWWRVSSEADTDYLEFLVDGSMVTNISGTKGTWAEVSNRVEGAYANHTLRWEYAKNGSLASSTDAGWVDDIIWRGDVSSAVITPDIYTVAVTNTSFVFRFLGERGIPYIVYSNATLNASGWAPMAIVPQKMEETNGLFRYLATLVPNVGLQSCFYRIGGGDGNYMVIDLSGGTSATNYPVTYLNAIPIGGWTDDYKTTKLLMRRVPAGTFTMGSPNDEFGRQSDETQHAVTLTKNFYIGVFEVTQRQWELVMGNKPSFFYNTNCYASRPVEQVSYYEIRENPGNSDDPAVNWPANSAVNATSFMGKLRTKTGLTTFDLPTESQWEYACRAGTPTALNSGKNITSATSDANMDLVARYYYNNGPWTQNSDATVGTAKVGSYLPNAWGLYDMHGNVSERCLDWYGTYPGTSSDPLGSATGSIRAPRGGAWGYGADKLRSADRLYPGSGDPSYSDKCLGFRAAMTLP